MGSAHSRVRAWRDQCLARPVHGWLNMRQGQCRAWSVLGRPMHSKHQQGYLTLDLVVEAKKSADTMRARGSRMPPALYRGVKP
eukprot:1162020-Pelagomonas_calceolata.AAC.2